MSSPPRYRGNPHAGLKIIAEEAELLRMPESRSFDPLASRAYVLFRTELAQQVRQVEELMSRDGAIRAEDVVAIGRTFHTIRGGAGFFGLDELARTAGELEKLFLDRLERDAVEVARLLESLRSLSAELPEPTGGADRCPIS